MSRSKRTVEDLELELGPTPEYVDARNPAHDDLACWLVVVDAETGERVNEVVEVNTREGWITRYVRKPNSTELLCVNGAPILERVARRVRLEWNPGMMG